MPPRLPAMLAAQPVQHPSTHHAHRREPTPLTDDDRDILAGISVMVLAIANRQNLADQAHMQEDDEEQLGEPMPCGSRSKDDPSLYGVKEVAHVGRHKYRPINGMVI